MTSIGTVKQKFHEAMFTFYRRALSETKYPAQS
jgi:hypothetical protein